VDATIIMTVAVRRVCGCVLVVVTISMLAPPMHEGREEVWCADAITCVYSSQVDSDISDGDGSLCGMDMYGWNGMLAQYGMNSGSGYTQGHRMAATNVDIVGFRVGICTLAQHSCATMTRYDTTSSYDA